MILYLETSVLVAVFIADAFTARAGKLIALPGADLLISDYAAAEFAAVIARLVRMQEISADHARAGFADFDIWTTRTTQRVTSVSADIRAAEAVLRRLDLDMRAPDALHIVIAQRSGGMLATFDAKMALNAEILGVGVAVT